MNTKNYLLSAGSLLSDKVKNLQGEDLGKLEEIMLDTTNGKIVYGVVSFGGFLGMGDKLFAVPWTALRVDRQDKCLRLDCDKKSLETAPGFNKDSWPDMADPSWFGPVHAYYKQPQPMM